jgi:rRNA maturation protein Rpf1
MIEGEKAKQEEVQGMETEQLGSPIVDETKTNPDLVWLIDDDEDGETYMDYQSGVVLTDEQAKNAALVTVPEKGASQLNLYVLFSRKRVLMSLK